MSVTLIVDVGSSSVGAALVSISKGVTPKILFGTRLPVVLQNEQGKGPSLANVAQTLESVLKIVAAEHVVIHKSHVIFSSPWYISETKTIRVEHDSPVLITRHAIEQLTKESQNQFIEKTPSSSEVVEHRIIRTRLNGYDTPNPYNKKAKSLEVTFFVSMVAKDVLESVRNLVGKYFHIRNSEISSFSLAAWSVISSTQSIASDFLIIDVRGEVTDVSIVSDGALMKSLSFPQGKDALVQSVVDSSGQSKAAALSLINVALHGASEPTVQSDVVKFTEAFKQSWLQTYTKVVQDTSVGTTVPQTLFLIADGDIEVFFENILKETINNISLHPLKHLNLKGYVETSSIILDPFLALESIFVTMV